MCGFVGVWQRDHPVNPDELARMRDTLRHRGPDDGGSYVSGSGRLGLGFRRLSIIDLSAESNQPLSDASGRNWIVFNGEVYNYAQLRRELLECGHAFGSNGDAEVVLHAYMQYGPQCLHRFHGMFAFAIWNEDTGRLFIARDRLGIKPLYYYNDGSRFLFASETKAILAHHGVSRAVDPDALEDYLSYGYVPHHKAIFRNMHKLPAGHLLDFHDGEVTVKQYWQAAYNPVERPEEQVIDELRHELQASVRLWMTSDVPVGMFLSGGLDSSAVCSVVGTGSAEKLSTYAIGFDYEKQNELEYARIVAGKFGTDHHERIVNVEDARTLLQRMAHVYDEPLYDTSAVPTFYVSQFAAAHNKVVLTGDGGDELLFGYYWYQNFLRLNKRSLKNSAVASGLADAMIGAVRPLPRAARISALALHTTNDPMRRYFGLIGFFDKWEQRKLTGGAVAGNGKDPLWLFRKFYRPDLPQNVALRLLDVNTFLVDDILTKVDRASMANSLEARTPLLEHRLVEFAFGVPERYVYRNQEKKYLLKRAMEGILPHDVIYRKKRGFSAPVGTWLRGDLQAYAQQRLMRGMAVRDGVFSAKAIGAMMKNYTRGRWAKMWQLLLFEEWYRIWICRLQGEG